MKKMKQIINENFGPILMGLFQKIQENDLELKIDDIPVYNSKAQFIGGMVINSCSYTSINLIGINESLKQLSDMIRMVSHMEMKTWGILNGLRGIYRLYQNNLLHEVIDNETYELLKEVLDWRTFVDENNHYALINKPTNYYGVAFGIARYRELLGWEPEHHSHHLLERFIEHIDQFSGELGYMDETPGDGRFDRYTIVTPGEVTALLLATGVEVPQKIRNMLKKSCEIALQLANEDGHGFPYGRSSGVYGDTGILEVFSAAAELGGILSAEELEIAYAYSVKIMKKIFNFWYDKETGAVNLWDKGRKSDHYRNKNRILSETISIIMHVIDSYEHWKKAGFKDHPVCANYSDMLEQLNPHTYVCFNDGTYKRGIAIIRDGKEIWTLPIVNGGKQYYYKDAYLHIPFQTNVLEYVPECCHGTLIPQIIKENGDRYMPLVYTSKISQKIEEERMTIVCEYEGLCCMNDDTPNKLENSKAITTYIFEKNRIHREDRIMLDTTKHCVKEVKLIFMTFSKEPSIDNNNVKFSGGTIKSIQVNGFENCKIIEARDDGNYDTSHGRLNYKIEWSTKTINPSQEMYFDWTLTY